MIESYVTQFIYEYINFIAFFLAYAVFYIMFKTYFEKVEGSVVQIISVGLALFTFFIPKDFLKYFFGLLVGFLLVIFMFVVSYGYFGPSIEEIKETVKKHRIFFWVFLVLYLLLVVIVSIGKSGIVSTSPSYYQQALNVTTTAAGDIIISSYPQEYYQLPSQEEVSKVTSGTWFLTSKGAGAVTVFLIAALILSGPKPPAKIIGTP
jgi:hypothetical protein